MLLTAYLEKFHGSTCLLLNCFLPGCKTGYSLFLKGKWLTVWLGPSAWHTQQNDRAQSEDSVQPWHPPVCSLISLCCALNGQLRIITFSMRIANTLIRLSWCTGILLVFSTKQYKLRKRIWHFFSNHTMFSLIIGFHLGYILLNKTFARINKNWFLLEQKAYSCKISAEMMVWYVIKLRKGIDVL